MLYYVADDSNYSYVYDSKIGELKEYKCSVLLSMVKDGMEVKGADRNPRRNGGVLDNMLYYMYDYAYVCTSLFISRISIMDIVYIKDNMEYYIDLGMSDLVYHDTKVPVVRQYLSELSYILPCNDKLYCVSSNFDIINCIPIDSLDKKYAVQCDLRSIRRKILISGGTGNYVII